jgi:hypothetical protein
LGARGGFSGFIIHAGGGGRTFPLGARSPFGRRCGCLNRDSGAGGGKVSGSEVLLVGLSDIGGRHHAIDREESSENPK